MASDNVIVTRARNAAKKYTDSVALNGVPVNYPQIDGATLRWSVFDPVSNAYVDSGVVAKGFTPRVNASYNWEVTSDGVTWIDTGVYARGVDGAAGSSAYDIWLALGNTGTEQDFIDSIADGVKISPAMLVDGIANGKYLAVQGGKIVGKTGGGGGGGTDDYDDLDNKPLINGVTLAGDQSAADLDLATAAQGAKADTAIQQTDLADVATSGSYDDLTNTPTLADVATSGDYSDLTGVPTFADVATTGSYNDLADTPTIPVIDPDTVIDAGYVHTDNNYSNAEKQKVADATDHISDTANPHGVTLSQAASAQSTNDTVISGRVYFGAASEDNKYLTASEIAQRYASAVKYKGQLKYSAMTTADMNGIEAAADDHGLTVGDICGVHQTQLSYTWDGAAWNALPQGTDEIGDMYLVEYWYGTFNGKSYAGEVSAQIICLQVTPSVVFDLYLDTTILLDSSVTDSKIGIRILTDEAASGTLIDTAAKTFTGWLQAIRNNLKSLFAKFNDLDATKIAFDQSVSTTETIKDIVDSNYDELSHRDDEISDDVIDLQDNLSAHVSNTANPHGVTKAQVGLGDADNTSDLDKPISTATQTALDDKESKVKIVTQAEWAVLEAAPTLAEDCLYGTTYDPPPPFDGRVFMAVPDTDNMETVNRITANNGTWTVEKAGFINAYVSGTVSSGSSWCTCSITINGKNFSFFTFNSLTSGMAAEHTLPSQPVAKGDVIKISRGGNATFSSSQFGCYYIPPKFVEIQTPTVVVEPGGDYSLDEQPVLIIDGGAVRQKQWLNGEGVYRRTFEDTATASTDYGTIGNIPNFSKLLSFEGAFLSTVANRYLGYTGDIQAPASAISRVVQVLPSGTVQIYQGSGGWSAKSWGYVTLTYTKTV